MQHFEYERPSNVDGSPAEVAVRVGEMLRGVASLAVMLAQEGEVQVRNAYLDTTEAEPRDVMAFERSITGSTMKNLRSTAAKMMTQATIVERRLSAGDLGDERRADLERTAERGEVCDL